MFEFISNFPTPVEILLDPVSIIVYGLILFLFIWETLFPARALPKIKYWQLKGLLFFMFFILFTTYLPIFWDGYLASFQLFEMNNFSLIYQVLVGLLVFELVQYCWHRLMHGVDFFFRTSHQLHHSSERIDVPSSFMFSVNDMIGISLIGSFSFALILGLDPAAITYIVLITTFFGVFQHSNIRTPIWLGYIIQRPESHSLHHCTGIHAYNYTDLPFIDMLFGTFKNPKYHSKTAGFYLGASNKILDMLKGRDVTSLND